MTKVWLVTGSASGLGRHIAEAILVSGDRLVATARDPERLSDLVDRYGDQMRTAALDVTDASAALASVQLAIQAFGRLDVVVNNAGYGEFAPFEQVSEDAFRAVVETCFYGVVNVTRAALPVMRRQKSGHILQISSVGGRLSFPGGAAYTAAKWAVGGFTGVVAQEVAPFGVKMCSLEPGGMATNWSARAKQNIPDLLPEYEASVGAILTMMRSIKAEDSSDPRKVAQLILKLAECDHLPAKLLLGSDALHYAGQAEAARTAEDAEWRNVSISTDVTATNPVSELQLP